MNKTIFFTVISCAIIFTTCASKEENGNSGVQIETDQHSQTNGKADSIKVFEAHGTVISITPNKKNIIVKHGDIPGFMDPMTMPFPVLDTTILSNIAPRDSIKFTIEVDDGETAVSTIEVIVKGQ